MPCIRGSYPSGLKEFSNVINWKSSKFYPLLTSGLKIPIELEAPNAIRLLPGPQSAAPGVLLQDTDVYTGRISISKKVHKSTRDSNDH